MDILGCYEEWFAAIVSGDTAKVTKGIDDGLAVEARTNHGRTPLMIAARHGRGKVVDLLVTAGADVDATIYEVVLSDEPAAVPPDLEHAYQVLSEAAAKIPASDAEGREFARGFADFFSAIQEAEEDCEATSPATSRAVYVEPREIEGFEPHELSTALCHAAAYGHTDAVRRLINAGADVDAPRWDCTPPLVHAAARGDLSMVGLLIGAGADVDDGFDVTPLEVAVENGHTDVVDRLLQGGASAQRRLVTAGESGPAS